MIVLSLDIQFSRVANFGISYQCARIYEFNVSVVTVLVVQFKWVDVLTPQHL
jgi:hypothetical protein